MMASGKSAKVRLGWITIGALAVLTLVEYGVAVSLAGSGVTLALLALIALIKAWLIVRYFMHVDQLWRMDSNHGHDRGA